MQDVVLFNLAAIVAMIPSSFLALRRDIARDGLFWLFLGAALLGPVIWMLVKISSAWQTDLSTSLWATIAASMLIFAVTAAVTREAWRLISIFSPYMVALGIIAAIWGQVSHQPLDIGNVSGWIATHILVSVATYGLVTVAAVAALAATLQERALKSKKSNTFIRGLPSVADCDHLGMRLLLVSEVVLALGLATGMALLYRDTGQLLALDHKTILTVATFLLIGALLIAHFRTGLRGRKAARFVLLAYLMLTLGYPGVKFVTDVLLA